MNDNGEVLAVLKELRVGQKEIIALLSSQRAMTEEQIGRSRAAVQESIGLQKVALRRQRTITLVAVPGILLCVAAIAYLVFRYF